MAKGIMVLGTMSNVGKSLLTAGLCRVFKQDGYSVAPFKSQNMALNSFITKDGLEMGRAQVMQAEACGIEPEAAMNPILLKPTDNIGSQVIINGTAVGNMSAKDYYAYKIQLMPQIMKAYDYLSSKYDIIVVEGAGSPAEINLKENDIVNMGMAKAANIPALLVGDIDRGGVFAQLLGTLDLLDADERNMIKALVINKFRGDKEILKPGLDILEQKSGKPIVGVMPYINCSLDDEDSLSRRFEKKQALGLVDIAVIRLPRISNFTDFNAFECIDGVNVRYVSDVYDFGEPDMIIIPGTKNTIEDLIWLREQGLEAKIKQMHSKNKIIFGICGGYQIMGEEISDPTGQEHKGSVTGMGILPVKTYFMQDKTRTRVKGTFKNVTGALAQLNGMEIEGYEIHIGVGNYTANVDCLTEISDGACLKNDGISLGNAYGTYVHGIFDSEGIASAIVSAILKQKGINEHVVSFNMAEFKERQYDILADGVRENIDMKMIYEILNGGV